MNHTTAESAPIVTGKQSVQSAIQVQTVCGRAVDTSTGARPTTRYRVTAWVRDATPEQFASQTRRAGRVLAALFASFAAVTAIGMEFAERVVRVAVSLPVTWWLVERTSVEVVGALVGLVAAIGAGFVMFGSPLFPALCRTVRGRSRRGEDGARGN